MDVRKQGILLVKILYSLQSVLAVLSSILY